MKDANDKWCCAECGSTDVSERCWRPLNEASDGVTFLNADQDEYYCGGCETNPSWIILQSQIRRRAGAAAALVAEVANGNTSYNQGNVSMNEYIDRLQEACAVFDKVAQER